jgi:uncharacterized protein YbjT (DUF2867 family)
VARILIVGGGCRGRALARSLIADGHAVRITAREEPARGAIEAAGAECWIGTPARLATLRGALDAVTVACWLLGTAAGPAEEVSALHTTRLEFFLTQAIDSTVRGVVYEAAGSAPPRVLIEGGLRARALAERNSIPAAFLLADPRDTHVWVAQARAAIESLLLAE